MTCADTQKNSGLFAEGRIVKISSAKSFKLDWTASRKLPSQKIEQLLRVRGQIKQSMQSTQRHNFERTPANEKRKRRKALILGGEIGLE